MRDKGPLVQDEIAMNQWMNKRRWDYPLNYCNLSGTDSMRLTLKLRCLDLSTVSMLAKGNYLYGLEPGAPSRLVSPPPPPPQKEEGPGLKTNTYLPC